MSSYPSLYGEVGEKKQRCISVTVPWYGEGILGNEVTRGTDMRCGREKEEWRALER